MLYRQTRNAYENCNKHIFDGVGKYDIPQILPESVDVKEFIGFNYAKGCINPKDFGMHFFMDDYQFTRVWTNADAYPTLSRNWLTRYKEFGTIIYRISCSI